MSLYKIQCPPYKQKCVLYHERCQLSINCITQFQNMTSIMRPACLCLQMLGVCWGAFHLYLLTCRKKGFQIFWLWKYFPRVCTFIPVQILPCVYLVLRIEECHSLYFLTLLMKMGFKKKQNDTWHLFKTKTMGASWNSSSWMNDFKDSYRFVPRHQICHS